MAVYSVSHVVCLKSEHRSGVKVKAAVLGSPVPNSPYGLLWTESNIELLDGAADVQDVLLACTVPGHPPC